MMLIKGLVNYFYSFLFFLRVYCEYKYDQHQEDQSPEALIEDFLSRAQKPNWKWRSTRTRPPPEPTMNQAQCKPFCLGFVMSIK